MKKKKEPCEELQMSLIVGGGEVIVRVFADESAMLMVRNALKEEKAEVGLTYLQARVLTDMLGRVPGDGDDDDDWDR